MCRKSTLIFTVCAHAERAPTELCQQARVRAEHKTKLRNWLSDRLSGPKCRVLRTVHIRYGWCSECEEAYVPWGLNNENAVLRYWTYKQYAPFFRATRAKHIPRDIVFSSAFRVEYSPQHKAPLRSLAATMAEYCSFGEVDVDSYVGGIIQATLNWSRGFDPARCCDGITFTSPAEDCNPRVISTPMPQDVVDPWDSRISLDTRPAPEQIVRATPKTASASVRDGSKRGNTGPSELIDSVPSGKLWQRRNNDAEFDAETVAAARDSTVCSCREGRPRCWFCTYRVKTAGPIRPLQGADEAPYGWI